MFVIAAEFMGASEGLGYLLIDGQQLGKPAEIVAAILAFAVLGKLTDWLVVAASAPMLRWHDVYGTSPQKSGFDGRDQSRQQTLSKRGARARSADARGRTG